MAAVKTFRSTDNVSSILMVSDQPDLPIRKPPLSKQLWSGAISVGDIFYNPAKFKVAFQPNTRVANLNFGRRLLTLSSGEKVRFNQLLLATGLTARKLPGEYNQVVHFNSLADYRKVNALLGNAESVVVIGGGLLAVELAAAMSQRKKGVKLIFPGHWPLDRYLPHSMGMRIIDLLERSGVECLAKKRAVKVTSEGGVILEDGDSIHGDLILPLIGQTPSLEFLNESGIDYSNGLPVSQQLRVRGLDDVFACGDIISVDGFRERCPHEDNALRSGAHVGKVMLGSEESFSPSTFLYSEFLGLRLESIGFGRARDCEVAADQWDQTSNRGMAVMSNNNLIERLSLLNYQIDTTSIDHLSRKMIGKQCPPNAADMIRFVLKVAA